MGRKSILLIIAFLLGAASCKKHDETVIIFHAGSLSVPMKELKREFEARHQGITVLLEGSGSRDAARKVTDLGKACDIVASADYAVISDLLFPDHAAFNVRFATNEMALVFSPKRHQAGELTGSNWHETLLAGKLKFGHSDPERDPCGYRTHLVWKLAEKYYAIPGLYDRLKKAVPPRNIRPKEVDLIALVEAGALDYIFLYRSVALQHGLGFVELPPEINLGDPRHEKFYNTVTMELTGKNPGERMTIRGESMVYGVTMINKAANPRGALKFLAFMLGAEGLDVFARLGQPPLVPPQCAEIDSLRRELKPLMAPVSQ